MIIVLLNSKHLVHPVTSLEEVTVDHCMAMAGSASASIIAYDAGDQVKILKNRLHKSNVIMSRPEFKDYIYSVMDSGRL